eukprot:FR739416.1.p1 GENE.FR739416.1~~FR739416.1.p1  ORF type:complete len:272 (+),score=28.83 FR739416.1:41-817(+)
MEAVVTPGKTRVGGGAGRAVSISLVAIAAVVGTVLVAGSKIHSGRLGANWGTTSSETSLEEAAAEDSWFQEDCADYDDSVYTEAVCGNFDSKQCHMNNTHTRTISCTESYWCNVLCGNMCANGGGAICFYNIMSDLHATCKSVKLTMKSLEHEAALASFMAQAPPAHIQALLEASEPDTSSDVDVTKTPWSKTGLNDDMNDEGCGRHSYCNFCADDCLSDSLQTYLKQKYGTKNVYNPSVMKKAVIQIEETCSYFGYL